MSLQTSSLLPRQSLTFTAASLTVLIAFGASALPVPLMSTWTREFGLSTAAIGMTVLLYVFGNACSLLFFARLSEVIGRRGAVFVSLLFGLAACGFFLLANTPAFLMAGRLLQGLACGITTTAAMSWCVDSAPPRRSWLATAVSSSGPLAGFVIATIGAGVAIETQLAGTRGLFFCVLVLELLVSLLVFLASETVTTKSAKKGILKPSVIPPPGYGRRLALAATGFVGTSALTCFFQGFSARVAEGLWGTDAPIALLSGLVYISLVLPNALGAFAAAKFPPLKVFAPVGLLYVVTGCGTFLSVAWRLPELFLAFALVCGATQGALTAASFKMLLEGSRIMERARLLAALYLISYMGTCIPNVVIMIFGKSAGLNAIAYGFVLWFALTLAALLYFLREVKAERAMKEVLANEERREEAKEASGTGRS